MRQILEKCWEQNIVDVRHIFVDLKQRMALYGEREYGVKCMNRVLKKIS
jgi:hypothetical protein